MENLGASRFYLIQADLAYQLLKIAEKFTNNPDFALYWTDLAYSNFAVDPAWKVIIIDAEHIIVVDRQATKIGKENQFLEETMYLVLISACILSVNEKLPLFLKKKSE